MKKICLLCKFKFEDGCGISFHKFPDINDPGLFSGWVKSCGLEQSGVPANESLWVCGTHFKPDDYVGSPNQRRLVRNAVPSRMLPGYTVPKQLPQRTAVASSNAKPPASPATGNPIVQKPGSSLLRMTTTAVPVIVPVGAKRKYHEIDQCGSARGPYTKR